MKILTEAINSLIEERARELIADMEINVYVNGTLVDVKTRDDHMDNVNVYLKHESVVEAMTETPDYDEPLTFAGTGCVRRFA